MKVNYIYVDLDNTLMDFNSRYKEVTGVEFKSVINSQDRWNLLIGKEKDFYYWMKPFQGARMFILEIKDLIKEHPNYYLRYLSAQASLLNIPNILEQKIHSLNNCILNNEAPLFMCPNSSTKYTWAKPGDILIDDNSFNCAQWQDAKGFTILHENFDKSLHDLKQLLKENK